MDPGERRRLLAIDGDGRQTGGFPVGAGTPAARQVDDRVTLLEAACPAVDRAGMGLREGGNDTVREACHV